MLHRQAASISKAAERGEYIPQRKVMLIPQCGRHLFWVCFLFWPINIKSQFPDNSIDNVSSRILEAQDTGVGSLSLL